MDAEVDAYFAVASLKWRVGRGEGFPSGGSCDQAGPLGLLVLFFFFQLLFLNVLTALRGLWDLCSPDQGLNPGLRSESEES